VSCGGRVDRFFRFALRVTDVGAFEYDPPSVLSHFEAADLLDALSIGVVVLDAHLCVIYANVAAQDALAFRVDQARGRPGIFSATRTVWSRGCDAPSRRDSPLLTANAL
jgi:PAS domain-containing protein